MLRFLIKQFLTNIMLSSTLRAAPQILLHSINLKPLKMLTAKLYLHVGWCRGGAAHPIRAGVGGGTPYYKKVNYSLTTKNKYLNRDFFKICTNYTRKISSVGQENKSRGAECTFVHEHRRSCIATHPKLER